MTALAILSVWSGSFAFDGQWKLYPSFDADIRRVVDTPKRVYMFSLAQPYYENVPETPTPQGFLYVYDKDADEFSSYDAMGPLTQSVISQIEYNAQVGYLIIIYDDQNIDLLFDNGKVYNIPALKSASIPSSKRINGISFDRSRHHAYLATDFGFVIIDDNKKEIYESRIYNTPLQAIARLGDMIVIADKEGKLKYAPATAPNFSYTDFGPLVAEGPELGAVTTLFRISDSQIGVISLQPELPEDAEEGGEDSSEAASRPPMLFSIISIPPAEEEEPASEGLVALVHEPILEGDFRRVSEGRDGHFVWQARSYHYVSRDGKIIPYPMPKDLSTGEIGYYSGSDFWQASDRLGLRRVNKGTEWKVTKDYMMPNASTVFISQDMKYHPTYGMLVSNHGNINYFPTDSYIRPIQLSALKGGDWIQHGLRYTNSSRWMMMFNPSGLAIDPKKPEYVYFGSLTSGIGRISLRDSSDIFHMSTENDRGAGYPEFVAMLPMSDKWDRSARMAPPVFDREGNLWSVFNNLDSSNPSEIWVWPRANIDATKDAKSFKPWVKIPVKSKDFSWNSLVVPLSSNGNTTRALVSLGTYGGGLAMVDHKGTFANTSDDVQASAANFYDQDGQPVSYNYIRTLYEDPSTGLVWVGTDSGVFTVNPSTFMSNPSQVNRIKVARDDGTSLADYLLNGVDVSNILDDPFGRKWFATVGGGIVCTTSDGRVVKGEWTAETSSLPDNNVYGIGWNDATGSLMISTAKGLCEFFPSGEGDGSDFDNLRVFPNPVRPEYFGWVTIDGLTEGALVKITDAHGNTVRELGRVEGGTIQWDAANLNGKRVPSGVYYILASGGESDSGLARVGKVLVVN